MNKQKRPPSIDTKLLHNFKEFMSDIELTSPCGSVYRGVNELSIEEIEHDMCEFCHTVISSSGKKFVISYRADNTKGYDFAGKYACKTCLVALNKWLDTHKYFDHDRYEVQQILATVLKDEKPA